MPRSQYKETNRGSKGVKLVNLSEKDKLIGISEVIELDEETSFDDEKESENDEVRDVSPTELIDTEAPIDATDQNNHNTQDETDIPPDEDVVDEEE